MQQTFGSCGLFSPLPFLHAGLPRLYTELANAICHTIPSTFTIKLGDDAVKWNISHRLINLRLFRLMSNLQTMFGHIKTHASCYYSDSISKNFFLSLVFCTLWRQSLIRSSPADFGRIVLLPCNLFIGLAPWVSVPLSERGRPCEKLPSPSLSPGKTW